MAENDNQNQQPAAAQDNVPATRFSVQRIFVKDASFEAPDSPECFRRPYNPQINFNINSRSRKIEDNFYEVVLRLTADVKQDDKTLFLVEVQQAGVFEIAGLEGERMEQVLRTDVGMAELVRGDHALFDDGVEEGGESVAHL